MAIANEKEQTLAQIYARYSASGADGYGDKGTIHSYIDVYESLLSPYRAAKRVLEIGILSGHSLLMWEEYFAQAKVTGVDVSDRPLGGKFDLRPLMDSGLHDIRIMDASDPAQALSEFGGDKFDVVVEDASHMFFHQMFMYGIFRHLMAPNGIYIIEDVAEIDILRPAFERIDPCKKVDIVDLRHVKGRFDDVLVIVRPKL